MRKLGGDEAQPNRKILRVRESGAAGIERKEPAAR